MIWKDVNRLKRNEMSVDISDEEEAETNESNVSNESNETVETKQSISTKSDTKNKYDNIIYSPETYV